MENNLTRVYNENDLFRFIQQLRLTKIKSIVDEKIANSTKVDGEGWNNLKRKIVSAVGRYETNEANINIELETFNKKYPDVITYDKAFNTLKDIKNDDSNGVTLLLFAIKVVLDNEFNYDCYTKENLQTASEFIYGDQNRLLLIKSEVEENFKLIAKKPLNDTQKKVLYGAIATSIAVSILVPSIGMSGLVAAGSGLAAKGVLLTTGSLLFSAALIYGTYKIMDTYNKEQIKKQFKKLSSEETAIYLSIQAMVISHLKKNLSEEEYKTELDNVLASINMLKADLDYFLFVEKDNVSENKEKLMTFHGFDNALMRKI